MWTDSVHFRDKHKSKYMNISVFGTSASGLKLTCLENSSKFWIQIKSLRIPRFDHPWKTLPHGTLYYRRMRNQKPHSSLPNMTSLQLSWVFSDRICQQAFPEIWRLVFANPNYQCWKIPDYILFFNKPNAW